MFYISMLLGIILGVAWVRVRNARNKEKDFSKEDGYLTIVLVTAITMSIVISGYTILWSKSIIPHPKSTILAHTITNVFDVEKTNVYSTSDVYPTSARRAHEYDEQKYTRQYHAITYKELDDKYAVLHVKSIKEDVPVEFIEPIDVTKTCIITMYYKIEYSTYGTIILFKPSSDTKTKTLEKIEVRQAVDDITD